jgi:transcriptional regulator with XRE-family HTH domain
MPSARRNPIASRSAAAIKRVLARRMRREMESRGISVSEMAKALGTGRTSVRRILDEDNTSITLETMARAAGTLGMEVSLTARRLGPAELGALAARLPGADRREVLALKKRIAAGFYA